ncbi:MAG: hypothetical protein RQ754_04190 [Desulfuromonadales bacterium]|nr:hypothetical protein [Desulfuromonadales bacterium]
MIRLTLALTLALLILMLAGCMVNRTTGKTYTATYTYGVDVDVVRLCGEQHNYWVWPIPEIESELNSLFATRPETPFYIEFSGEILQVPQQRRGDSAGLVFVRRIGRVFHPVPESCQ